MALAGNDPADFFADPILLYFPVPENPRPPPATDRAEKTMGHVTLSFGVGTSGRIRSLATADSQPPKLMDFRVRRSMRSAIFRPRLVDGEPIVAEDQTYTHEFEYFPTLAQAADAEAAEAAPETPAVKQDDVDGDTPEEPAVSAGEEERSA